jgi:hypothetical protein
MNRRLHDKNRKYVTFTWSMNDHKIV